LERYITKDAFNEVHRTSSEFLKFKEKMNKMVEEGSITKVDGHSYFESNIGFV
jgi:hypothetical protein